MKDIDAQLCDFLIRPAGSPPLSQLLPYPVEWFPLWSDIEAGLIRLRQQMPSQTPTPSVPQPVPDETGKRQPGRPKDPRAELAYQRVREALREAKQSGARLTEKELARQLNETFRADGYLTKHTISNAKKRSKRRGQNTGRS